MEVEAVEAVAAEAEVEVAERVEAVEVEKVEVVEVEKAVGVVEKAVAVRAGKAAEGRGLRDAVRLAPSPRPDVS